MQGQTAVIRRPDEVGVRRQHLREHGGIIGLNGVEKSIHLRGRRGWLRPAKRCLPKQQETEDGGENTPGKGADAFGFHKDSIIKKPIRRQSNLIFVAEHKCRD